MTPREREFKEAFERDLPEYAKMCQGPEPVIIFQQDAFATDYESSEFSLLGMGDQIRRIDGQGSTDYPAAFAFLCIVPSRHTPFPPSLGHCAMGVGAATSLRCGRYSLHLR
jgi:hypothetical protein